VGVRGNCSITDIITIEGSIRPLGVVIDGHTNMGARCAGWSPGPAFTPLALATDPSRVLGSVLLLQHLSEEVLARSEMVPKSPVQLERGVHSTLPGLQN
jgi:NaMN:DMB phosphoribosyltransferase